MSEVAERRGPWPLWARVVVSLILAIHIVAVVAGAMAVPPSSPLERSVADQFMGYYQFLDQGHAHRYYAPEPGPTPIVTARLRFADGRPEQILRLPDRSHRPRLLYQRELALANHLYADFEAARNDPHGRRDSPWAASYARHLCRTTSGCSGVSLYVQLHLIPPLERLGAPPSTAPDADPEEFYTPPSRTGDFESDPT